MALGAAGLATFLRTASPPRVRAARLPSCRGRRRRRRSPDSRAGRGVFDQPRAVLRLPPADDPLPAGAGRRRSRRRAGPVPVGRRWRRQLAAAAAPGRRRRRAACPRDWARPRPAGPRWSGPGPRRGRRCRDLAAVVVLDEHDEALQEEGSPTWHARDVAVERARRAGVPCVLVSPCPSLEAVQRSPLVEPSTGPTSAPGWPRGRRRRPPRRRPGPDRPVLRAAGAIDPPGAGGGGPGWCACSTARAGRGCWPAAAAASSPAASACDAAVPPAARTTSWCAAAAAPPARSSA